MNLKRSNQLKVGVVDSGIGGLSVLKEVMQMYPDFIGYYGYDLDGLPYGNRLDHDIQNRVNKLVKKIVDKDVDVVLIACNTATAISIDLIRERFDCPIVGIEPFLNYPNKLSLSESERSKIAVLTTQAMALSTRFESLKNRCDPRRNLTYLGSEHLAKHIDQYFKGKGDNKNLENIIFELDRIFDRGQVEFNRVILGCTHYPLIKKLIEKRYSLEAIDPSLATARQLLFRLNLAPFEGKYDLDKLYFSSNIEEEWVNSHEYFERYPLLKSYLV